MNKLVQLLTDEDGEPEDYPDRWHLVDPCNYQGDAALCTAQFFGVGESPVLFNKKTTTKGGLTCPECLKILKAYKSVKL